MTKKSGGNQEVYYIDAIVGITGVKTGYSLDVPVRYIKSKV